MEKKMETKTKSKMDEMIQEATQKRQAVGMEILPQDYEVIAREARNMESNEGDEIWEQAWRLLWDRHAELMEQIEEAKQGDWFPRNLNKTQLFMVVSQKQNEAQQKWFRAKSNKRMEELAEATYFWDAFLETLEKSVPTTA
jgi:hypothetical protein